MGNNRSEKSNSILMLLILFLGMAILGITDSIHGVTIPLMKNDFGASNQDMGTLNATFTAGCVVLGFVSSWMLGRFGIKKTIFVGSVMFLIPMITFPVFGFSYLTSAVLFLVMKTAFVVNESAINGLAAHAGGKNPGRTLSLTHFFFGAGAMVGPMIASLMVTTLGLSWKLAYLLDIGIIAVFLIMTFIVRVGPSEEEKEDDAFEMPSVFSLVKNPLIILFGITFAFIAQTEYVANSWGIIYLEDFLGIDPAVGGATFLSEFFFFFAASRLIFGMFLDKIGYKRMIVIAMICTSLCVFAGFLTGESGVFLLAFSAFFAAIQWPAMLALVTSIFGKASPMAMSVACTLGNVIVILLQLLNGYMAETYGGAWGYRMCMPYSIISLVMFSILTGYMKLRGNKAQ